MAEVQRLQGLSGIQATLEQMDAYKETLEREQAARQQAEADEAAEVSVELEALIEAAYLVAVADGRVSEAERRRLVERVGEVTGGRFSAHHIEGMLDQAAERVMGDGAPARAEAIAEVLTDPDLRRAALLVACAVAWLDGGVGQREGLALQALARAFDIPIAEMHQILSEAHG